jgi:hypothetical protein
MYTTATPPNNRIPVVNVKQSIASILWLTIVPPLYRFWDLYWVHVNTEKLILSEEIVKI